MIDAAAEEYEEITDPIGGAEAEHLFVECRGCFRIRYGKCKMTELDRDGAAKRRTLRYKSWLREQLNRGSLGVAERQHAGKAGNVVLAGLAFEAHVSELARHVGKTERWRHLEGQTGTILLAAVFQNDRELAAVGGKKGTVFLAIDEMEPNDFAVIVDLLVDVGRDE